jgi:hypothetical protein
VNPESRKPGRNVLNQDAELVGLHLRAAAGRNPDAREQRAPQKRAGGNRQHQKLPRNGTAKTVMATMSAMAESTSPTRKYASILPSTISVGRSGVESTCSMVPISHSRAMVSDVSCPARITRITAISPGHDEVLRFERAVVPDAHARIDPPGGCMPLRLMTSCCTPAGIALHHAFGVPHGDRGGVGIAAVHQQLHLALCPDSRSLPNPRGMATPIRMRLVSMACSMAR